MKKPFIIAIVSTSILLVSATAIATNSYKVENNGVEHEFIENRVTSSTDVLTKQSAETKIKNLNYKLPSYIPEGFELLDEVGYTEPPVAILSEKSQLENMKELQFRMIDKEEENIYEIAINKGNISLLDESKQVELKNGIKADLSHVEDNNSYSITFKYEGASYFIAGLGEKVNEEEITKIANSIVE